MPLPMINGQRMLLSYKIGELNPLNGICMTSMTERPQPPGASECCESGCARCVWDTYYDEMRVWKEQQAAAKAAEAEEDAQASARED